MSTNYIGKNSLTRFLEKLYETFSKKGHAHSKADILDFPVVPTKLSELTNDSGFVSTDNDTTYTLTKSGNTITLTGTDGSVQSVEDSNSNISVDSELSGDSTNPVQNKVIKEKLDDIVENVSEQIEMAGNVDIDLSASNEGEANLLNADTLGGKTASEFATLDHIEALRQDILGGAW